MKLMKEIFYACKDAIRLISLSYDTHLPLHQKIRLNMHLAMCKHCSCHKKQLRIMLRTVQQRQNHISSLSLAEEKKKEIKKNMLQGKDIHHHKS